MVVVAVIITLIEQKFVAMCAVKWLREYFAECLHFTSQFYQFAA